MSTQHLIVKAARTALGMSRKELASRAGLSDKTIYNIETAQDNVLLDTLFKVRQVFTELGIELVESDGVRGWGMFFRSDKFELGADDIPQGSDTL